MIVAPPPPARVQVVAQEFRYALSRRVIKAGWAVIELRNMGEDAHDLRLQRVGGRRVYVWPLAQAGETVDREYKLLPGTYRLTCAVANHSALGMVATLHVEKSPYAPKRRVISDFVSLTSRESAVPRAAP